MSAVSLGMPFWRFWTAAALANVGDGIRLAALPLLAASLTDDPVGVSIVAAAQFVPWLVAGLLAGSLADRRPPRQLIAVADAARALVLLALVVTIVIGWANVWLVAVAAFLLGLGETLRDTAAQTVIPRLVPTSLLERANGRLTAAEIVGNEFVGPPVGSALFVVGAAVPFAANGGALALAVMLVLSVPFSLARRPGAQAPSPVGTGLRAGLRWLVRHRTFRMLTLVVGAVAAADSAWFGIFVLYARERLGVGAAGFGWLLATGAAGGVVGSFLAERLISGSRHRPVVGCSIAVTTATPLLLVWCPYLWAAAVVTIVTSGGFAVMNVAAVSMRHRLVPDGLVGRVTAASRTVSFGAAGVGAVAGGALASDARLAAPFVFSGVVAVLATAAWSLASRE